MLEESTLAHAAPLPVVYERRFGVARLAVSAPDGSSAVVEVDRSTAGVALVTLTRVKIIVRDDGRAVVPLSAPLTLPLRGTAGHLRALVAVCEAAIAELEREG